MRYQKRKRNTPIATLIKNYVNKKSGKVSVSREEIKWRFDHLDWKDQKKILAAFLDSCLSDREWAYTKLLDYWDETFALKVKELWETYHEYRCSWSVIRYFPVEYITAHMDEFTDERDYYFISLRLAKDQSYVIDRRKLSDIDYLALLYHTNRDISDEEARDTLFSVIHDCCLRDTFLSRLEHIDEYSCDNVVTPANYREVRLAIFYLRKLDKYDIEEQFYQWNKSVGDTIRNSPEFKAIDKNDMDSDYEYDRRRTLVANIYAFQALDEKYKQPSDPTVGQMRQSLEQRQEWVRKQRGYYIQGAYTMSTTDFTNPEYDAENDLPF